MIHKTLAVAAVLLPLTLAPTLALAVPPPPPPKGGPPPGVKDAAQAEAMKKAHMEISRKAGVGTRHMIHAAGKACQTAGLSPKGELRHAIAAARAARTAHEAGDYKLSVHLQMWARKHAHAAAEACGGLQGLPDVPPTPDETKVEEGADDAAAKKALEEAEKALSPEDELMKDENMGLPPEE